jgi:DivIVA domain-containing protein
MSAIELDVPVLISGDQIRRREFVTTRRGYDADQVRDYLEQLADQVELMATMIRDARQEAEAALRANAQPKEDPYEVLARRVTSVIREADSAADRFRADGRRDAERILVEARTDADRIRTDAQSQAEDARANAEAALRDARAQADRTLAGLSTRREALVEQLSTMQTRLLGVAKDLEAAIEAPGDLEPLEPQDGIAERVVDVRPVPDLPAATQPGAPAPSLNDALFAGLDDPAYEDLWDGSDAIELDLPDIPPLDLAWDVDADDAAGDDPTTP